MCGWRGFDVGVRVNRREKTGWGPWRALTSVRGVNDTSAIVLFSDGTFVNDTSAIVLSTKEQSAIVLKLRCGAFSRDFGQ